MEKSFWPSLVANAKILKSHRSGDAENRFDGGIALYIADGIIEKFFLYFRF